MHNVHDCVPNVCTTQADSNSQHLTTGAFLNKVHRKLKSEDVNEIKRNCQS